MNSDPSTLDFSNVTNPLTLASIALIVGGIVRILRTKKINDMLDAIPVSWINRIPKTWLPWIAQGLAVGIAFLDLTLNAHLPWKTALIQSLFGIFAGSLAIAGHETLAKPIGARIYKPQGPVDPKGPLGPDDPTLDPGDSAKPPTDTGSSPLARGLLVGVFVLAFAGVSGCAPFLAALPDIITYIMDGMQVLDVVNGFVQRHFAQHPDAAAQAKVTDAIEKARAALNLALRSAQGTSDVDKKNTDAAFDNFKAAYLDLITLMRSFGMNVSTTPASGAMRATVSSAGQESLEIPEPLVFKKGAKR